MSRRRPFSRLERDLDLDPLEEASIDSTRRGGVWEYELYGGAQLAPHRLYVLAKYLTPPKGVWEGPRALIHLPRNTRCRFLFPPPCLCLPCLVAMCMGSVLAFVRRELDPPLPPKKGDHRVGAHEPTTTCKKPMTDPPTDDTEARDGSPTLAPGPTDAGSHTHLATATPEACLPTRHSPTPEDGRGPTWSKVQTWLRVGVLARVLALREHKDCAMFVDRLPTTYLVAMDSTTRHLFFRESKE
eukprot:scaffold8697_cov113-Isochrysis_galbana.AAC.3